MILSARRKRLGWRSNIALPQEKRSQFFAWCEAREDDFASPARSIRKPAKEKSRDRVVDDSELKLTWEAARPMVALPAPWSSY
jgi:hypothetical protein